MLHSSSTHRAASISRAEEASSTPLIASRSVQFRKRYRIRRFPTSNSCCCGEAVRVIHDVTSGVSDVNSSCLSQFGQCASPFSSGPNKNRWREMRVALRSPRLCILVESELWFGKSSSIRYCARLFGEQRRPPSQAESSADADIAYMMNHLI